MSSSVGLSKIILFYMFVYSERRANERQHLPDKRWFQRKLQPFVSVILSNAVARSRGGMCMYARRSVYTCFFFFFFLGVLPRK